MSKVNWIILSCSVLLLLSGCGNDGNTNVTNTDGGADSGSHDGSIVTDSGTPTDGGTPVDMDVDAGPVALTLEEVPDAYVQAYCSLLFSCPASALGGGEGSIIQLLAMDETTCRASLGRLLFSDDGSGSLSAQLAGVDAGTLTFDGLAARECVTSLGCEIFNSGPSRTGACEHVFNGTVASGDACSSHSECAGDDVRCVPGDGGVCPGTCGAAIAIGDPCRNNDECTTVGGTLNSVCTYSEALSTSICADTATVVAALGEPCSTTVVGTTQTRYVCAAGLFCDSHLDGPAVCAAIAASGGACTDTSGCPDGEWCTDGTCSAPPTIPSTVGEACGTTEVPFCNPFTNVYCSTETSLCVATGDGSLGTTCFTEGFSLPCNPGLYCDGTNTCADRKADGMSCSSGEECESNNCASPIGGGPIMGTCSPSMCYL